MENKPSWCEIWQGLLSRACINLCSVMETVTLLGVTVTTVTEEHLVIGISSLIIDAQTGPQTPAEITRVC